MNNSGDAAEQVVRFSLEGTEVALKLTGSAAKNVAAMLYAVLKDQKKTKGKTRIAAMLRTQRPLTVYTMKKEDCAEFERRAKGYGILYSPIPYKKTDETVDILVYADDAARANRIIEKFRLTAVDTASIKSEIEKSRQERSDGDKATSPAPPEQTQPEKSEEDRLLDEMLGAPAQREEAAPANPSAARTDKSLPSEPTSKKLSRTAEGTAKPAEERPSVRQELREIKAKQQREAEPATREEPAKSGKKKQPQTIQHKQPARKKSKKNKER